MFWPSSVSRSNLPFLTPRQRALTVNRPVVSVQFREAGFGASAADAPLSSPKFLQFLGRHFGRFRARICRDNPPEGFRGPFRVMRRGSRRLGAIDRLSLPQRAGLSRARGNGGHKVVCDTLLARPRSDTICLEWPDTIFGNSRFVSAEIELGNRTRKSTGDSWRKRLKYNTLGLFAGVAQLVER